MEKRFKSFAEFYPFYLGEHRNRTCRRLHFLGSTLGLGCAFTGVVLGEWVWFLVALFVGYLLAWIGHFVFEKNRPATFKYPLWSFMGDWKMWWQILTRQLPT